jgi:hypothetical protein
MPGKELVQTLDYILNRCNEAEIEAVAAAVVRRRRDIALFGSTLTAPDPKALAKKLSSQLNIEGSIEGLTNSVREYAVRIIRQQAPELTDRQIEELTREWIPQSKGMLGKAGAGQTGAGSKGGGAKGKGISHIPENVLTSMINQFVAFSLGQMEEEEDAALRKEIGPWPDKYWKAFPQVIRLLISDFLKNEIDEGEFKTRMGLALQMH